MGLRLNLDLADILFFGELVAIWREKDQNSQEKIKKKEDKDKEERRKEDKDKKERRLECKEEVGGITSNFCTRFSDVFRPSRPLVSMNLHQTTTIGFLRSSAFRKCTLLSVLIKIERYRAIFVSEGLSLSFCSFFSAVMPSSVNFFA